jgi:hypothetical protein
MSPPTEARLRGIDLSLVDEGERLDGTLSALRRRHAADAIEELERWRPDWCGGPFDERDLTLWVRDECRLHVQDGRFEHAIALIERYRRQQYSEFKQ